MYRQEDCGEIWQGYYGDIGEIQITGKTHQKQMFFLEKTHLITYHFWEKTHLHIRKNHNFVSLNQ